MKIKLKCICVFILITEQLRITAAPFSMFRADKTHSGKYFSTIPPAAPHLKWEFHTKGFISSSCAVNEKNIYFGSSDNNFYCLDKVTGKQTWKIKTNGPVNSSPALENNVVYFLSFDGYLYALSAETGKEKWKFRTAGEKYFSAKGIHGREPADSLFVDDWDFYLSSPLMDNGNIYFGTGSGVFYSLDKATGKEIWNFKCDGIIHSSPAIAYGIIYFGSWDTYMHALEASSGKEIWKYKTGDDFEIHNQTGITGSPLISDSICFFGGRDSYLYAVNAITGIEVWKRYNNRGWISMSPVISEDKLIYASGSSKFFWAVNKYTGDSIYRKDLTTAVFSSPAVCEKKLCYGNFLGELIGTDINSGNILWVFKTDGNKNNRFHLIKSDNTLDADKLQEAYDSHTEIPQMEIRLSTGSILSSPVIDNGIIYFGSGDGNFYAVE